MAANCRLPQLPLDVATIHSKSQFTSFQPTNRQQAFPVVCFTAMRSILILLLLLPFSTNAQPEPDLLKIVDRFFQAMADRDTTTLQAIMTEEGIFHAFPIGSEKGPRAVTHQQFISDMGKGTEKILERYWEPEVWIGEGHRIGTCAIRLPYRWKIQPLRHRHLSLPADKRRLEDQRRHLQHAARRVPGKSAGTDQELGIRNAFLIPNS